MRVMNLESAKGNKIPNQFTIHNEGVSYFQSYNSLIAKYTCVDGNMVLTLGSDWDYSVTTLKYLYIWLDENCWSLYHNLEKKKSGKSTIQNAIDCGKIKYDGGMR
jgi:hypothetical protein